MCGCLRLLFVSNRVYVCVVFVFQQNISHANISGLDLVYYRDGFTYHTDRDTPDRMTAGSLQVLLLLFEYFLLLFL